MAQRSNRVDRFAQMTKQEEIISKKRQEILEKQRTVKLAREVAAAQTLAAQLKSTGSDIQVKIEDEGNQSELTNYNDHEVDFGNTNERTQTVTKSDDGVKLLNSFTGKTGKIVFGVKRQHLPHPSVEQPPSKLTNTFCNDGSFLENFKKILENQEKPKPPIVVAPLSVSSMEDNTLNTTHNQKNENLQLELANNTTVAVVTSMAVTVSGNSVDTNPITFSISPTGISQTVQPPPPPPRFAFNPTLLPQAQPQLTLPPFFHGHLPMQLHPATVAPPPPPPPPPPQLPIALANLAPIYMQLGPPQNEAMPLNTIPTPKDFDLSTIPKPQLNLDAIQMPVVRQAESLAMVPTQVSATPPPPPPPLQQELEQKDQLQKAPLQVFSESFLTDNERNCIKLPTCIENLITLVAENGDDYEDKIRLNRSELHPALWFLYDKNCEQYRNYRTEVLGHQCKLEQKQKLQNEDLLKTEDSHQLEEDGKQIITSTLKEDKNNSTADKYDPESAITADFDSDDDYMRGIMDRNRDNIKRRIECRNELSDEERREREDTASGAFNNDYEDKETQKQRRKRERKSRWGEKEMPTSSNSSTFGNQNKPILSAITRSDHALLQYARLNYGSTQLSEEQWKQCEEHFKVNLLYQDMMRKRQEIDRLSRNGKFKYEYDSDEDIEGGTWEHKLRTAEMEATHLWANALTKQSEGKHHIGDFLPPEELKKFMEQYEAKKNDRQPDLSDYKEYKLKEDNIGFKMLQKLGWREGQGLGQDGAGIIHPVNKAPQRDGNQGLGVTSSAQPEDCDNEYDAYRKRMMLAYRFRPNPLNNPRRAYY